MQAIANLISNAIKYSEPEKLIQFNIVADGKTIIIEIIDQGIGIPESDQMNIFDRFFRANNAGNAQGTGLGLNIVQNYVELMEGEVTFTSEVGKGTIFNITLPDHLPVN